MSIDRVTALATKDYGWTTTSGLYIAYYMCLYRYDSLSCNKTIPSILQRVLLRTVAMDIGRVFTESRYTAPTPSVTWFYLL